MARFRRMTQIRLDWVRRWGWAVIGSNMLKIEKVINVQYILCQYHRPLQRFTADIDIYQSVGHHSTPNERSDVISPLWDVWFCSVVPRLTWSYFSSSPFSLPLTLLWSSGSGRERWGVEVKEDPLIPWRHHHHPDHTDTHTYTQSLRVVNGWMMDLQSVQLKCLCIRCD